MRPNTRETCVGTGPVSPFSMAFCRLTIRSSETSLHLLASVQGASGVMHRPLKCSPSSLPRLNSPTLTTDLTRTAFGTPAHLCWLLRPGLVRPSSFSGCHLYWCPEDWPQTLHPTYGLLRFPSRADHGQRHAASQPGVRPAQRRFTDPSPTEHSQSVVIHSIPILADWFFDFSPNKIHRSTC